MKKSGFILTEYIVALGVFAMLLAALGASVGYFREMNKYQLYRVRCTNAAQAELDSVEFTGKGLSKELIENCWSNVEVKSQISDGQGQWYGLKLITAQAKTKAGRKNVKIELARYLK